MQISLRSHLIAGTAAVVGVSAIAMTPVTMQHLRVPVIPVPSVSAGVALAAFDSPISQLIETLGLTNTYLFSPTPWQTYAPWSDLSALGVVPQIINDHLPIISQLGQNGADYLLQTFTGLGTSAYLLSEGVWNAAANLLSLNIPGAITTLLTALGSRMAPSRNADMYRPAFSLLSNTPNTPRIVRTSLTNQFSTLGARFSLPAAQNSYI